MQHIYNGFKIPEFEREGRPSPFSQEDMNLLVRAINALLNFRLVRGSTDKVVISDHNITIQISGTGGSGTTAPTGGGMNYRGEWSSNPVAPYALYDVVVISTGANAGSYICVEAATESNPATGIDWVNLSRTSATGQWQ